MKIGNNRHEWWLQRSSGRTLSYVHTRHRPSRECYIWVSDDDNYDIMITDGVAAVEGRLSFRVDRRLLRDSLPGGELMRRLPSCSMRADG